MLGTHGTNGSAVCKDVEKKSLLDDGVFSEKDFEEEKEILKQRFHVSQPGVSPAASVAVSFHVSQPGVSPAASQR